MKNLTFPIVCMLFAGLANAEDASLYGGVGFGLFNLEDEDAGISFDDSASTLNLYGGYRFSQHFGVEGFYLDSGEMSDDILGVGIDAEVSALGARAVGFLPLSSNVDLYGSAGLWSGEVEFEVPGVGVSGDEDDDGLVVGGGIRGKLGKVGLQGGLDWFDSDSDTTWQASVSAFVSF